MAATAFSPQLSRAWSASPSYLWEVPGKPVIVHVALDVVDRLDREVGESFRSLEARGAEIGGLLLGAVQGSSRLRKKGILRPKMARFTVGSNVESTTCGSY